MCLYVCVDAVRFSDRLHIDVVDGVSQSVDVSGCGQGIAVITVPSLPRRLCLGPCYCGQVAHHQFTVVNKGRRQQTMFVVNTSSAKRPAHVSSLLTAVCHCNTK